MRRIFTPVKIQRLRPGLNPQTWVPEASMLTTRPPKPSDNSVTYVLLMNKKLCIKVNEIILYYDARSKKHQIKLRVQKFE